ncbi:MAG: F0F1 ATP synthase subunit A, partial [Desulfosporosinus sp.]
MEKEELVLWHLGNMSFHGKTLVMTWMAIIAIIVFCYLCVRNLTSDKPGKMQNVLEWVVDFVKSIISENMDYEKGRPLLNYMLTLIMFVLFSNMVGLFPNLTFNLLEHFHIEFAQLDKIFEGASWMSPTADVNTSVGLGILSIILVVYMGIKHKGLHYFHHFVEPYAVLLPVNIIDFVMKPVTLGLRLFGNIFAGEVLLIVLHMITGPWALVSVIGNVTWLAISVAIGLLQAYIIVVLTVAYINQA